MTGLQELRHRTGSSGRPTPTRRLPVKSRRGRCPHRPGGTSPQKIRRAACPHAAARQAQRFPPSRQASTSAERVADGDAEAIRKQGANLHIPVRVAEGAGTVVTSVAERIPKPLVLAAFFPPFLSPQKEREPRSAQRSAEYYGLPHQRRRSPARNDRVFCKGYSARPSGGVGAPRPTAIARSAGERAYYWWCSAAGGQRRPPLRTSGWMPPWAAG